MGDDSFELACDGPADAVYGRAVQAAKQLGYSVSEEDAEARAFCFDTADSMDDWAAHEMEVSVVADGPRARVVVGGHRGAHAGDLLGAWGEKKAIARLFFEELQALLGDPTPA